MNNDHLIKSASYASVIAALIIMSLKCYGWYGTESQSMLASLIDSVLDIFSSLINFFAIRISLSPPDDNHRFGHDKFQDLAIFSQSIFFFASSIFMIYSATKSLYLMEVPENLDFGANIMYISIFITFFLVAYQTYVIKKTNSRIISADKLHYFVDLLTNVAVVISLISSNYLWYIDGVIGIIISLYIMYASYKLFKSAMHNLVDEEFLPTQRSKIIEIIKQNKHAKAVHELKTRLAGDKSFIQFHLELNGKLLLKDAHDISLEIANQLKKNFPKAEIIIHQDPYELNDENKYLERIEF